MRREKVVRLYKSAFWKRQSLLVLKVAYLAVFRDKTQLRTKQYLLTNELRHASGLANGVSRG